MNEHEELENELAELQPVLPTAGLKQRIGAALADDMAVNKSSARGLGGPRSRGPLWLAAICGPLAACFTFYLLWTSGGNTKTNLEPSEFLTRPITAAAFDTNLPSLWSYRQAISQSPEQIDALLDKHAQHSSEPKPQRAGAFVSVFARSDSQLDDFLGEL